MTEPNGTSPPVVSVVLTEQRDDYDRRRAAADERRCPHATRAGNRHMNGRGRCRPHEVGGPRGQR